MKNLNYITVVEFDEFELIKNSKHKDLRVRLSSLKNSIESDYNLYLNSFSTIQNIGPSTYNVDDSAALRSCYLSKTAASDSLLTRIVDNQTTHFKHICPYCLLIPRITYDHYIPEGSYPVYSVLAKNLIPCCSICNSKKSGYWRINDSRAIIHFYNDLIPDIQFLFATLSFNQNNVPSVDFTLSQSTGISNDLFSIIQEHFNRLELCDRYSGSIDLVASDIIDDIEDMRNEFGDIVENEAISRIILRNSNRLKQHYGVNYWKSIIMDLLANSTVFIESL